MLQRMAWSKHVVKLNFTIEVADQVCLFMEYCPGGDLFDRIDRDGPLPRSTSNKILQSLAEFANDCLSAGTLKHFRLRPTNSFVGSVQMNL